MYKNVYLPNLPYAKSAKFCIIVTLILYMHTHDLGVLCTRHLTIGNTHVHMYIHVFVMSIQWNASQCQSLGRACPVWCNDIQGVGFTGAVAAINKEEFLCVLPFESGSVLLQAL